MGTIELKTSAQKLIIYLAGKDASNEYIETVQSLLSIANNFEHIINAAPPQMTTPAGFLPINSTGMRALVDYCTEQERTIRDLKRTKSNLLKQVSDLQYKLNEPNESESKPEIKPFAPINIVINIY